MDAALGSFTHPAAERDLKWDPRRAGWIREYLRFVDDPARRSVVERLFTWAEGELTRLGPGLRTGVIYNDANDYNVLVDGRDPYARRVTSVVDFGDMLHTWTANEAAVACTYAMLDKPDPLAAAVPIVEGYHAAHPLAPAEIEALFPLICSRLAVSVVNSAYQRHADPENEYLTVSERPAWELLDRLGAVHPSFAHYSLRGACGLEPCPATPTIVSWLRESAEAIGPLLDPDPRTAPRVVFDFSVGSPNSGTPALWSDIGRCARKISQKIADTGASVGIGCYDEARGVYTSGLFSKPGNDGTSWRTVHLGLDLFVSPGTAVLAPLDGVVHSAAENRNPLDYGPTIVLEHRAGPGGPRFYTLYGHLAGASDSSLTVGAAVRAGSVIAQVGTPAENGGWPPHLHFQLITDLLDRRGDFPGVADPAERRVWLSLVPDPNLVARIPGGVTARPQPSGDDILAARRDHIGPSLSVSYRRPLTIVRGWMQHLYDADGPHLPGRGQQRRPRRSLPSPCRRGGPAADGGAEHEHAVPARAARRVRRAACRATLPDPLRVCYFVNSGSEANELALRLARCVTGSRDTIVVDVGYHGNTNAVVEISPYKFNGPGGAGAPPYVHVVPTPDVYRGVYGPSDDAGARYAAHVAATVDRIAGGGGRVGAFIAESILSCAGQIVLPPGYLRAAYEPVRAAGGVCIADEVQVGFGRVRHAFLGVRNAGRHARHRHDGEADRQRAPAWAPW